MVGLRCCGQSVGCLSLFVSRDWEREIGGLDGQPVTGASGKHEDCLCSSRLAGREQEREE